MVDNIVRELTAICKKDGSTREERSCVYAGEIDGPAQAYESKASPPTHVLSSRVLPSFLQIAVNNMIIA
jgi:hypothetical protein